MTSLKKQAEDLGIEVDGRWSDETLREKIEEAKAAKKQKAGENQPAPSTASASSAPEPAPQPAPGEARIVPEIGVARVETAEEVQQTKEGENQPVAPYEGDPKEAHALAAAQAERAAASPAMTTFGLPNPGAVPAEGQKEELYSVRLLYDWWDGQGIRHPRDEVVDLPLNEAKKLLAEGKGERADELTPRR
ncbi:MAG TPA: hypothetical protein VFY63_16090 [Pseudorhizobium sp.]|nr:hypothetical protein [Pseudorhizobium sp.]